MQVKKMTAIKNFNLTNLKFIAHSKIALKYNSKQSKKNRYKSKADFKALYTVFI